MPKRTRDHQSWLLEELVRPDVAANYLRASSDSPEMLLIALRNVAEARRMAKVAEDAGLNRESLYKALSEEGNPEVKRRKQCNSLDWYDQVRGWHKEMKAAMYMDFRMQDHTHKFETLPEIAQNALKGLEAVMYMVEGELARAVEEEKP